NDSKHPLGSHRDRHEHIGKGFIGDEGFRNIMNDKRLRNIPMVLETPKGLNTRDGSDVKMDRVNIERLMGLVGG
ncbi:deoxyribonuclease IV, partial [bacterium]|nr:deoxyribonuclease IV [bacterium]